LEAHSFSFFDKFAQARFDRCSLSGACQACQKKVVTGPLNSQPKFYGITGPVLSDEFL
jgi:hypothetical protein